jgi:hypothetical protein
MALQQELQLKTAGGECDESSFSSCYLRRQNNLFTTPKQAIRNQSAHAYTSCLRQRLPRELLALLQGFEKIETMCKIRADCRR